MMPTEMIDDRANKAGELDESAVAAVRGGDVERYRELVERHERRVFAIAWSRLGDAAMAETFRHTDNKDHLLTALVSGLCGLRQEQRRRCEHCGDSAGNSQASDIHRVCSVLSV